MNMFKKTGGFTLVELIVVIAILAILAGVAVPAYSGYIQNANKAADTQLLGAINTAFAAACAENGVDITTLTASTAVMPLASDKTVDLENVKPENVAESFEKFFAGNEDSAFKVYEQIVFQNGAFVGYAADELAAAGGVFAEIFNGLGEAIKDSVGKVTGSTFGSIGAEELMTKVDTVTQLAAGLAGMNGTFKQALAGNAMDIGVALGLDPTSETFMDDYSAKMNELVKQIAPNAFDADGEVIDSDAFNDATNQILANYAVLQAAKSTTKTSTELLTDLQQGIDADDIKNLLKNQDADGSTQEGLSKAAMMYAMYTAYANQLPAGEEKNAALEAAKTTEGFMANMNSDGFTAYLNGTGDYAVAEGEKLQAATDLEGYLGALDIINKSADENSGAVEDLLVNGYNDPTLIAALQGLLGK